MERRGHKFVRYADDVNIYVKTQRAAERVLTSCTRFLENKLKLRVNRDKRAAGSPVKLKLLGFCLGKDKRGVHVRIHPKSRLRFENKIREITRRNKGASIESIMGTLRNYIIGWLHFYGLAEIKSMMREDSAWIRRKLRAYIWKQRTSPSRRHASTSSNAPTPNWPTASSHSPSATSTNAWPITTSSPM